MDPYFIPMILAGAVGGGSAGLLGCYIVGMRIPFVGVCIAHSALAGAVWSRVIGLGPAGETWGALAAAMATAVLLGLKPTASRDRARWEEGTLLAIAFSFTMGIAFLGMGLMKGPDGGVLRLLWGNILFVGWGDFGWIALSAVLTGGFVFLFWKELQVLLLSRALAAAGGVHQSLVYMGFMVVCALVITMNLEAVGGLMVFSLIVNPAATAFLLFRGYRNIALGSCFFGGLSALLGYAISFALDLPTGVCIVLGSSLLLALGAGFGCRLSVSGGERDR